MSSFQPHHPAATHTAGTFRSADGRSRVLQGVPSGGQFAAERHSDSVISLAMSRRQDLSAIIAVPQRVYASVRTLVGTAVRTVRGQSLAERPYDRPRGYSATGKAAAALLAAGHTGRHAAVS